MIGMEDVCPQEVLLSNQKSRQLSLRQQQAEHLSLWLKDDLPLTSRLLADDTFTRRIFTSDKWLQADFAPGNSQFGIGPSITSDWRPAHFVPTSFGIQLSRCGIKLAKEVMLRALALEAKIAVRLKGEATLWISTRGSGLLDPEAVICRIRKQEESQRLFLDFGSLLGPHNAFGFFKQQELPLYFPATSECDDLTLVLDFFDYGDSRVSIDLCMNHDSRRKVRSGCSYFLPCLTPTHLTLLGSGESVEISSLRVRYIERITEHPLQAQECCDLL